MLSAFYYIPLLFMPIVAYVAIAFVITLVSYAITKSKKVAVFVVLFFVVFPVWDVPIQKLVREYYLLYKSEPIVYEKVEWVDGKIESLNIYDWGGFGSDELKDLELEEIALKIGEIMGLNQENS